VDAQKFAQFRDLGGTCSREGFYLYLTGRNSVVIHSQPSTYKFTIDRRPDGVVSLCVLSRRNLSCPSRHSTPNSSLINRLEPLCFLFPTPVLCFQQLAASFPKTPGVGVLDEKFRVSDSQLVDGSERQLLCFLSHPCNPSSFKQLRTLLRNGAPLSPLFSIVSALFLSPRGWYPLAPLLLTTHCPLPTTHYSLLTFLSKMIAYEPR
jgi:hypothetical protein